MTDMFKTIAPKSNQLNADDLIGRNLTIKITKVSLAAGEQPIAVNYQGDGGKPFMPCKGMRRVLVNVWGSDGNAYVGRSLTLYRDDKVMFGGVAVGGIRISHMSHIDHEITMALTASKSTRKPFVVKPLVDAPVADKAQELRDKLTAKAKEGRVALDEAWGKLSPALQKAAESYMAELEAQADKVNAWTL